MYDEIALLAAVEFNLFSICDKLAVDRSNPVSSVLQVAFPYEPFDKYT
jgi:hypothetical protein